MITYIEQRIIEEISFKRKISIDAGNNANIGSGPKFALQKNKVEVSKTESKYVVKQI